MMKHGNLLCVTPDGSLEIWQYNNSGDFIRDWTVVVDMDGSSRDIVLWVGGVTEDEGPVFWGREIIDRWTEHK